MSYNRLTHGRAGSCRLCLSVHFRTGAMACEHKATPPISRRVAAEVMHHPLGWRSSSPRRCHRDTPLSGVCLADAYIVCRHDRRGDASFASLGVSSHPVRHCRSASCAWVANPSARCLGPTSVGVSLDIAASGRRPIDASRRSLGFCSRRMAHLSTHVLRTSPGRSMV